MAHSRNGVEAAGRAALVGWRGTVGRPVAARVAARTPFDEQRVEAAIGLAFLLLSILYVARTLKRLAGP
jgi:hypothetical protein